ncbi:MAG: PQQ-binding-like beta-propeller repeat protein [Prevotella sp.]|nr:PQQ-binding-like beta-propeller repeat protein [Prevotella sp.]
MMKRQKALMLCLMLAGCMTVSAQQNITEDSIEIGETMLGHTLKARRIAFEKPIYRMSTTEDIDLMAINLLTKESNGFSSGRTTVAGYSMKDECLRWQHEMKGGVKTMPTNHGILVSSNNSVTLLANEDGSEKWKKDLIPVMVADSLDIVLGYKNASPSSSKLLALRISTGEKLWEGKVKREVSWGWDDIHQLGNNSILVVADDINIINLITGDIRTIDAKTGFNDLKAALLMGLAGAAGAIIGGGGGYYYTPMVYGPNVVNGLSSNILQTDSCYYVADRNSLRCFNNDMTEKWRFDYPTGKASTSVLLSDYNTVYMINFGYGRRNGNIKVKHSRPFIASLNALTGEPFFFNPLKMKKDIIEDALVTPQEAYFLFDDGMAYQRDINDSIVNVNPWDSKQYGKLAGIVHDTIYAYREGEQMFTPIAYDGEQCPVITEKGTVYMVNRDLQQQESFDIGQIYVPMIEADNYMLAARLHVSMDYWLVHKLGMPIAHITIPIRDAIRIGNKIYMLTAKDLVCMEVDNLIRE